MAYVSKPRYRRNLMYANRGVGTELNTFNELKKISNTYRRNCMYVGNTFNVY